MMEKVAVPPAPGAASDPQDGYSFSRFARHAFFAQVNQWLVEHVGPLGGRKIVDLGCGPGAVTELILEQAGRSERTAILGVDPSWEEIRKARDRIRSQLVEFVRGTAESLSRLVSRADVVLFCNAIHLVEDKRCALREIRRSLAPGGVLGFNTTFFAGAYPEGTQSFWRRWMVRSLQELAKGGRAPVKDAKVTAREWLSAGDYVALAREAGFADTRYELQEVVVPAEGLEDIARFSLFIEGALPGVPLAEASEALIAGLHRTLAELGVSGVRRNWLQCMATVPA